MQNTDCTFICEQFTDYQDKALPSDIRAKVDTHLASCSPCRDVFQELSSVIESLHHLPPLKASNDFTATLLTKIDSLNQETVWQKFYHASYTRAAGYAIAAGLIVAIGINLWIDPIATMERGVKSGFAGQQNNQIQSEESLAGVADSAANLTPDSLTMQNTPINPQVQSMQLVSGKK